VSIGVNPWRLATIQEMVAEERTIPWEELVRCDRQAFVADGFRCYAQSWSMIYFLRTAPAVEARAEWREILPEYFDVLKSAWAAELAKLASHGKSEDRAALGQAASAARSRAVDAAFEGVDLAEIETAWRAFVAGLDAPAAR
jgi:hypothetical protein